MSDVQQIVARLYGRERLLDKIKAGLAEQGVDSDDIRPEDLKPVDEFHIGGARATMDVVDQLEIDRDMQVLDVGCGIGGAVRAVAEQYHCQVSGVDLTPEYVECARALSDAVGLGDSTRFEVGSATELPFENASFDRALLLHVGMNVPDKPAMMHEVRRVLRPGGIFAVFDVMRIAPGDIDFPVPWAVDSAASFLEPLEAYQSAADGAGFSLVSQRERGAFALEFFAQLRARTAEAGGPPPIGLHLLMGETAQTNIANMVHNIEAGRIAPVELVLQAPA